MTRRDLVDSRFFPAINSRARAGVVSQIASDYGLSVVFVACHLGWISGKPAMDGAMLAAILKRSERYRYRVKTKTAKECSIEFQEKIDGRWESLGVETFTMEMAIRARLTRNPTWQQYPEQMLFWRALAAGARTRCPDVLAGGASHLMEELAPELRYDENGVPVGGVEALASLSPEPLAPLEPAQVHEVIDAEVIEADTSTPSASGPGPEGDLDDLIRRTSTDPAKLCLAFGVSSVSALTPGQRQEALGALREKLALLHPKR